MFIPHGKYRLLECPALDSGQEIRELLVCGQLVAFLYAGVDCSAMEVRKSLNPRHLSKTPISGKGCLACGANTCILLFTGIFCLTGKV
jgi:hypothetical protein